MVYDETGDRLSPTHANKKGRRYRYYISKRLIHQAGSTDGGWRLSARELEGAVARTVSGFLGDEPCLIDALQLTGTAPDRLRTILGHAAAAAADLNDEQPERHRQLLHRLLHRVTLRPGSIHIELKRSALASLVAEKDTGSAALPERLIDLTVAFQLKRRGVEAKLVIHDVQGAAATPDKNLIARLARAHRWFDALTGREATSVQEIARRDGIDASDVGRSIQIAFLAPDIVEAILAGRQPVELTARRLMRIGALPIEWDRQRRFLGFPA